MIICRTAAGQEIDTMINIIGLGYIGLPTALMFASHGCEVVGTDYNPQLIATLNAELKGES